MINLSDSHVDKAVRAALEELKKAGVSFDSRKVDILKENLTEFLVEDCAIDVIAFEDLNEENLLLWVELAREKQGEDLDAISLEETERQAKELYRFHDGRLPEPESAPKYRPRRGR
ncbi:hypothetical protein [Alteromonas sp. 14N.309.X.WAT.G.H12]|uniref:hypothetical protein n=1 Tax=Alteromonas sp. 14N.309.X.WAT.G.H12 TaxID=3120824 RepID=UPI002FD2C194